MEIRNLSRQYIYYKEFNAFREGLFVAMLDVFKVSSVFKMCDKELF